MKLSSHLYVILRCRREMGGGGEVGGTRLVDGLSYNETYHFNVSRHSRQVTVRHWTLLGLECVVSIIYSLHMNDSVYSLDIYLTMETENAFEALGLDL
jgi:hypothetical protein